VRPLTQYEQYVLASLEQNPGRAKSGNGPWERAFVFPVTAEESAAMGRLYRLGLVERRPGVGKRGASYRAKESR
jgi:hypothetical protein